MNQKMIPRILELVECGTAFATAGKRAGVDKENIEMAIVEAIAEGVGLINPSTVANVRSMPEVLQLEGMLHVLDLEEQRRRGKWSSDWYYYKLAQSLTDDLSIMDRMMQDPEVKNIADVLRWIEKVADQKEAEREMRCDGPGVSRIF